MSDDHPPHGSGKKAWWERIFQIFQGEPKDRQELAEVIQDAEERELIDEETKDMMEGVLEITELRVRDIMIPRSQMVTIEKSRTVAEFLPMILESGHSRFPVINEDKDHVEGILLAKDMLRFGFGLTAEPFSINQILRASMIVPESKRVDRLLQKFQKEQSHMAIVVDEFGGVSGLVTIEDILELIVGEIDDEYDEHAKDGLDIHRIGRRTFILNALTPINHFNDYFTVDWRDDEVDTLGGIVVHAFGHLPERGENIEIDGFTFKVMHGDRRRLLQLKVKIPENHLLSLSKDTPEMATGESI